MIWFGITGVLGRIPLLAGTFRVGYRPQVGAASAPLLGVMFGIGRTPCIGPTRMPG
jgi:cytochrome c-type biogenesis protein